MTIDRRALLAVLAASTLAPKLAEAKVDAPRPFDFLDLQEMAKRLRSRPYKAPVSPAAAVLDRIDYVEHGDIRHSHDKALFKDTEFPVTYFPLGQLFRKPVRLFSLVEGMASEIPYAKDLFQQPSGGPGNDLPDDAGFAGFRIHDRENRGGGAWGDWAAFLGASYFRSAGDDRQYGISARGIAVNTADPLPPHEEEFPDFTRFYVSPAKDGAIQVLALLEGPSLTGAFRFSIRRDPKVAFSITSKLYLRKDLRRLGIAPGTSMYNYSETLRYRGPDWRPEVHDSDGLLMQTGAGERIWRPLNNPPRLMVSAFSDENPRGFGLMQRDRSYANYRDQVRYERRPHLWVEPRGDWGKGSVQLVEIPTETEYHDNIVAFWVPERPARAGDDLSFDYVLNFSAQEPGNGYLAHCVATRMSRIAPTPVEDRVEGRPDTHRDFVVEFGGATLAGKDPAACAPEAGASRGTISMLDVVPEPDGSTNWRVFFRVHAAGPEPVELRLVLRYADRQIAETWLYQYHPEHYA